MKFEVLDLHDKRDAEFQVEKLVQRRHGALLIAQGQLEMINGTLADGGFKIEVPAYNEDVAPSVDALVTSNAKMRKALEDVLARLTTPRPVGDVFTRQDIERFLEALL